MYHVHAVERIYDSQTPVGYVAYAVNVGSAPVRGTAYALLRRTDEAILSVQLESGDDLEPFPGYGPTKSSIIYLRRGTPVDPELFRMPGKPAAAPEKVDHNELYHALRRVGTTDDGAFVRYRFTAPHSVYSGVVERFVVPPNFEAFHGRGGVQIVPGASFAWRYSDRSVESEIRVPIETTVPPELLAPER